MSPDRWIYAIRSERDPLKAESVEASLRFDLVKMLFISLYFMALLNFGLHDFQTRTRPFQFNVKTEAKYYISKTNRSKGLSYKNTFPFIHVLPNVMLIDKSEPLFAINEFMTFKIWIFINMDRFNKFVALINVWNYRGSS